MPASVAKTTGYAVLDAADGASVAKAVPYAVLDAADGATVAKTIAYAIIDDQPLVTRPVAISAALRATASLASRPGRRRPAGAALQAKSAMSGGRFALSVQAETRMAAGAAIDVSALTTIWDRNRPAVSPTWAPVAPAATDDVWTPVDPATGEPWSGADP